LGARAAIEIWDRLDPGAPGVVVWPRPVKGHRVALLLGTFDPPTNAHLALARATGRALRVPAALCMTKVLLARGPDRLLTTEDRIAALDAVAERCGFGVAFANRGTYLEVGRALLSSGMEPIFVVGSDKLEQLADASFYPDGDAGVAATFEELDFVVVPRRGSKVQRADLPTIDASEVFENEDVAAISASRIRSLVRAGSSVEELVPPEVALALRGYTSAR
jgi:nicotinic acid mononucleotide adenylyltransferase